MLVVVPAELVGPWSDLAEANATARSWRAEVNARSHTRRPPTCSSDWRPTLTSWSVPRGYVLRCAAQTKVARLGMVHFGAGRCPSTWWASTADLAR
jgi:hypothetical protein